MKQFGIIGFPVGHSFSAKYFSEKFEKEHIDAIYTKYPLEHIEDIRDLLAMPNLAGLNVTIPHKIAVTKFLQSLDETAETIGAVNVIARRQDGWRGYNTDAIGFMSSIRPYLQPNDKRALILGTGGASRAVHYGMKQLGIVVTLVSRTPRGGGITYDELDEVTLHQHNIIVNCTPLGMTPNIDVCPNIPYQHINSNHLLFDCVYTPEETLFLKQGKTHGARCVSGMGMLIGQAEAAWKIWNTEQ